MHMHFKVPNLLDSLSGSKKVVIGIAVIEGSVLAANVYFILHCSGFEDIDPQSSEYSLARRTTFSHCMDMTTY